MDRLEGVREVVDGILHGVADLEDVRCGFVHLYGVSLTAALLAERRGLNAELAAVAGMLHDMAAYEAGDPTGHAERSAERAAGILRGLKTFTDDEIGAIRSAIAHHSDKAGIHGPFDELLKDADVLQHCFYSPSFAPDPRYAERAERLARDLGIG
jgi:HD superfamily phosphodiesterase